MPSASGTARMTNETKGDRTGEAAPVKPADMPEWPARRLRNGRWQAPASSADQVAEPAFTVISVKMRRAEAKEFRAVCAELGVRPNRAFRAMARHAVGYVELAESDARELRDVTAQLRGIATNVNQIAKAGNRTRSPDHAAFMEERARLAPVLVRIQRQTQDLLDIARRRFDGRERLQRTVDRMDDDLI